MGAWSINQSAGAPRSPRSSCGRCGPTAMASPRSGRTGRREAPARPEAGCWRTRRPGTPRASFGRGVLPPVPAGGRVRRCAGFPDLPGTVTASDGSALVDLVLDRNPFMLANGPQRAARPHVLMVPRRHRDGWSSATAAELAACQAAMTLVAAWYRSLDGGQVVFCANDSPPNLDYQRDLEGAGGSPVGGEPDAATTRNPRQEVQHAHLHAFYAEAGETENHESSALTGHAVVAAGVQAFGAALGGDAVQVDGDAATIAAGDPRCRTALGRQLLLVPVGCGRRFLGDACPGNVAGRVQPASRPRRRTRGGAGPPAGRRRQPGPAEPGRCGATPAARNGLPPNIGPASRRFWPGADSARGRCPAPEVGGLLRSGARAPILGILQSMVERTVIGVPAAHDHVVLASADSEAFTSLRKRSTSREDRYRMGKELRQQVPRSSLGDWKVRGRPARPGRADQRVASGAAGMADSGPGRADGRHSVRVPARLRHRHGRGRRPAARHRHHPGDLR